ncbi:MAG TPA: flagellar basal-body rod protein FlgF [Patescibacteria group bacterium]|nr:flagellar basal-body rod protein FlgF [Patescibacteria group bacterium]
MIRGIYTAASGMIVESLRNDVIANNLANVDTAGYKKDVTISKDFASLLLRRINDGKDAPEIGSMGVGALVDKVATIHTDGALKLTGNELDLAISGNGFFSIETPNGVRYSRNGSFTRNAQGELVTQTGNRVLGTNNTPIILGAGNAANANGVKALFTKDGRVYVDNLEVAQLQMVEFADPQRQLDKEGYNLYKAPDGVTGQAFTGQITQGVLETSNANVVTEMVNMIAGQRAYETNAKVVQSQDELLDKAVNDVGAVS